MDSYIGKMLDNRYEILERIGTGGMAVVYKAKCHRLNRLVAVKILKSDLAQDEDFRRRFNAESQAVAQLSHPNIVSVYDVSRGGDTEYIVMELIDGITLKQYMEKRGQLNWRETLHFITQIMRGLSHAHSRGIVHRDIKPQNIMVLRDGSVKVADFGIACLENAAQTLTQEALGSVHYISPEQARGDRIDARSDIYSAGVVLYEMLTGRLPFEGDSAVSVAIQHLSSIPLAPREINPEIPEQLELICMKAMASDIDKRYYSADAMIADLETFRKNPGVDLDFELSDLRPDEADEPTRPLRISEGGGTGSGRTPHRTPPVREHHRDYDDYDEPPRRISGKQTVLIVIAALLATALAVTLFRSILGSFDSEQYAVKNVVGLTVEEAMELEGVKGIFEIREAGEVFSDYAVGVIAEQSPQDGEVRKGESLVIEVWVSAGKDVGKMVDVTGLTVAQANIELKQLKEQYDLEIDATEEQFDNEVPAGQIISSIPAEGEALNSGDTVRLVVSKGPQPVEVPLFVGIQLDIVAKQMESMKLTYKVVGEEFSDKPAGEVINQNPVQFTAVPEGTEIQLTVSKGPEDYLGTDNVIIPLPENKTTGNLVIYQDGGKIFEGEVDCTVGNYAQLVHANGETKIVAYLDDEMIFDETITVDGYYG